MNGAPTREDAWALLCEHVKDSNLRRHCLAVEAVRRAAALDRHVCRAAFDARFTVDRMARDYLAVYEQLLETERPTAWAV